MEVKRILLVEDDPRDIELTLNVLSDDELATDIEVANDGIEALDYIYQRNAYRTRPAGNPNVILLDIKMPKLNGIQVIKKLKSDPQMRSIPIVVLTSSQEQKDLEECYHLGANAYIVKPASFSEFKQAIRQADFFWTQINEPPPGSMPIEYTEKDM